jgi:hypothetical protein
MHLKLFSGPFEAGRGTYVAASTSWLFWNLIVNTLLGEDDRHRAGFALQRALLFKKRVKAPKVLGEAARA